MIYFLFLSVVALFAEPVSSPETRALAYLSREVPRWSAENQCYSCHNNGDAARALYTAHRLSLAVPPKALEDTTLWLSHPEKWDHNGGEGPADDKVLARIQFAAALVDALDAGLLKDSKPLKQAAELVAERQNKDGSWHDDASGNAGSPATYGACLATCQARRALAKADPEKYRAAMAKADHWLRTVPVKNVPDAAAVVLALDTSSDADALKQRDKCLELMRKGQSNDGGWGPYVTSASEPFDTAVVILALSHFADKPDIKVMIKQGRAYLIATQQQEGNWQETTRPAGAESYAQRISTTGWATLALLCTRNLD